MKGKLVALLFIVVFALLVGVVFSLLNDATDPTDISDFRIEAQDTESIILSTPPVVATQPPAAEPSWLPNPTPVPTPTPMPTPVPTPEPLPTPPPNLVVAGTELGSGQFKSNSPVWMDVVADWTAKALDAENVVVTVTVSAESYALHLDAAQGAVNIKLGDEYITLDGPALTYDGSALQLNQLASTSFTLPLSVGSSNTYDLAVAWHFGGVYGSKNGMGPMEVPSLECGGIITLVR